jgi:hypothetical protein
MAKVSDIFPTPGRQAKPLIIEIVRELTPQDMETLSTAKTVGPPPIQKLRAIHHRQAQLLASGRKITEVSAIVGTTPTRLQQLLVDPGFMDLMAYYQDQIISSDLEDTARLRDKLVDVAELALDEMRDRLEDNSQRKAMPMGELRQAAIMGLDRTVAPPKATQNAPTVPSAITLNFGASPIDLSHHSAGIESPTIDITPKE